PHSKRAVSRDSSRRSSLRDSDLVLTWASFARLARVTLLGSERSSTSRRQALAPVRCAEIERGPDRNDARRVDHLVALVVVILDVIEMHRRVDSGDLK